MINQTHFEGRNHLTANLLYFAPAEQGNEALHDFSKGGRGIFLFHLEKWTK